MLMSLTSCISAQIPQFEHFPSYSVTKNSEILDKSFVPLIHIYTINYGFKIKI